MPESALKTEAFVAPPAVAARAAGAAAVATGGTTITVQEALAAIWQDSRSAPARYLDDAVVPHGGE